MKAIAHYYDRETGESIYTLLPDVMAINAYYNKFREAHRHYSVVSGSVPYAETWKAYRNDLESMLPIDRSDVVVNIVPEGTYYYNLYLKNL